MKKGWEYKKLLDVCDFQGGAQPPKSEWVKNPQNGYVRMLQIRDFTQSREAVPEYVKLTNKVRTCSCDDIMVGRYGASVGKILTGLAGAYNVALMKTLPDKDFLIKPYLRFYLLSNCFQGYLTSLGGRAAQAGFSKDDLANLSIALPPLSEQKEIVEYLDSSFAKIGKLKENAAKNLEEAKALFQSALKDALESKEGWEEKTLKEISIIYGNYGLSVSSIPYNGVRYLRITDITENGELNDDKVSADISSGKTQEELQEGDILFARTGATVGKTLIYRKEFGKCLFAGYLIRYRLNKDIVIPQFIHHFTHSSGYYKWVSSNQKAAAQPNIGAKVYNELKIHIPPLSEQQSIVSYLDSLNEKVNTLQQNYSRICNECDALKQAILRQVFE